MGGEKFCTRIPAWISSGFRRAPGGRVEKKAALVCFAAYKTANLARIAKLASALQLKGVLWVVYPEGAAAIREIEVRRAGRAAGAQGREGGRVLFHANRA